MSDEETVFQSMARAHPHEVYETFPEEFWGFFQEECPDVPREEMERMLRETEEAL